MCDALLEAYTGAINNHAIITEDLVPSILLFTDYNCGGIMTPSVNGTFQTNPYTTNQTVAISNVKSFFIPFNFKQVIFNGEGSVKLTVFGPRFVSDVRTLNWTSGDSWEKKLPLSVQFKEVTEWNHELLGMCHGDAQTIGAFSLTRYQGGTPRCDEFMENTWCVGTAAKTRTECNCFEDLPKVQAKSKEVGVNLPVTCFGQACATTNAYRTNAMLLERCNLTLCEQIVKESPGVINEGEDTIFCGGRFYTETGEEPSATTTVTDDDAVDLTSQDDAPYYVWVMLGVSAVLFFVLIYLLFSPASRQQRSSNRSILQQLQAIRQSRVQAPASRVTYAPQNSFV